jgi:hypothetical protein
MEFDMPATLLRISVAKDYSDTPGPRSKDEGDYSGQEFLERLLLPMYEQARSEKGTLLIDLDGTEGYATSFLEAAFGELARRYKPQEVLSVLTFKSDGEPYLIDEIKKYISEAER